MQAGLLPDAAARLAAAALAAAAATLAVAQPAVAAAQPAAALAAAQPAARCTISIEHLPTHSTWHSRASAAQTFCW